MNENDIKSGDKRTLLLDTDGLAEIVSERRRELRLTLEDVARLADVSRHLVSSIEKGDASSHLEKLLRILDSLQIKVELKRGRLKHIDIPPKPEKPARTRTTPFISVDKMKTDDGRFICLECGANVLSMYVHAKQQHGLSIAAYRQRWGIDPDVSFTPQKYTKAKT